MNPIKSIALSIVAGASVLFPMSTEAQTRVSACHLGHAHTTLTRFPCDVTRRVNSNGHIVWDVRDRRNNDVSTVVLWTDKSAEVIFKGRTYTGKHYNNGYNQTRVILDHNDYNIIF